MSKEVDSRVVEMRFDNKQFEANIQTSLSTIEKLKQSLNLKGASKGFENVSTAAKNCDVSGVGTAVETIRAKFSSFEVVAVTALANITNSAINTGKRMVSALTIDPIMTGFSEYETKIGSIQTIMSNTASKGTTMQDVTRVIDELNTYADKTIYNFAEMTRNIGTFTAAGVGLEESAAAIQGIANLAAASGSSSQQASTAMYQLSQALAAGTVKLMDWNSVVNAGMGGEKFQEALKATAREHGVAVDKMIKDNGSFRDSLQEGWITADILNETLNKFTVDGAKNYAQSMMESGKWTQEQADALIAEAQAMEDAATKVKTFTQLWDTLKESAQSGWGKTWEILVGDFEEAQDLFTSLSDTLGGYINAMSDARNNLLQGAMSSGWKQLIGLGIADVEGFKETVKEVGKEYGNDVDQIIKDTGSFEKSLKTGWATTEVLTESISRFSTELSGLSEEELKARGYTAEQVASMKALDEAVKNGSVSIDELATRMTQLSGREHLISALKNVFNGLLEILKPIKDAFKEVFDMPTANGLYDAIVQFEKLTEGFKIGKETAEALKSTFKGLFSIVDIGLQVFTGLVKGAATLVGAILPVGEGMLSVSGSIGDFITKINEAMSETNIFGAVFGTLAKVITPVANAIKSALTSVSNGVDSLGGIIGVCQKVAQGIGAMFNKIKELASNAMGSLGFDSVLDAVNGGLLAGVLLGLKKFIKSLTEITSNGPGIIGGIKDILDGVSGSLKAFQSQLKAGTLLKIASAIAILAGSLVVLSLIDPAKLGVALTAVSTLFIELFGSMAIFEKIMGGAGFKAMGKISRAMIGISTAILILSAALKVMSSMSWGELAVGLTGLTAGLAALIAALHLLPKDVGTKTTSLIGLSTALVILGGALKIMASMSWGELATGLTAMVAGLTALIAALHLLPKDVGTKTTSLIGLSTAMVILGAALKIMGSMSWSELAVGLSALAGGLIIFVGALHLLPKDMGAKAVSLIAISTAMVILGAALKVMGSMSWEGIAKGLVTLAGSLTIIAVAMNFMTSALPGAAALLVISAALAVLTPSLMLLGSMSWEGIAKGLATLAGAFTVIGVAGLLLSPITPAILALGAAVALIGVGCLAAGAGTLALAAGLTALAVAFTASGATIMAAIQSLISLIPTLATAWGQGIVAMATAIGAGAGAIMTAVTQILNAVLQAIIDVAPKLCEAIVSVINSLLQAVIETAPKFVEAAVTILTALLEGIAELAPKVVETVLAMLQAVLDGIVEFVPMMVEAGLQLITGFLQGIADNIGGVVEAAVNIVVNFLEALGQQLPRIVDAGFNMIISFIDGLTNSIATNGPRLAESIRNLITTVITTAVSIITGSVGSFLSAGASALGGFLNGVKSKFSGIYSAIKTMISQMVSNIKSKITDFVNIGKNIVDGIKKGISNAWNNLKSWFSGLFGDLIGIAKKILGIASPSRAFIAIGKFIGQGLAQGIRDYTWQAVHASEEMSERVSKVAKMTFEDAKKYIEDAKSFDELSLAEELEMWEAMIAKYGEGTEERLEAEKKAYAVYKELRSKDYQDSMDWIDQEKYYNRLSLEEELAAYERVQARYQWGSDEWIKMEKEKYRVKNEIMDASYEHSMDWIEKEAMTLGEELAGWQRVMARFGPGGAMENAEIYAKAEAEYFKKSYEHSEDWIDKQESLYDKLAGWKRVQVRFAPGGEMFNKELYQKATQNIADVQEEINKINEDYYEQRIEIQEDYLEQKEALEEEEAEKSKEIKEQLEADIKSLNDAYDDAVESRRQSLYDAYGLFDKVDPLEEFKGEDLFESLKSQVAAFEDWQNDINGLAGRGINGKLLDELREMGPSSAAQIKALNNLSDHELNEYVSLWQEKYNLANEQATYELEDMRIETKSQIQQLRYDADMELEELNDTYAEKMRELRRDTNKALDNLYDDWVDQLGVLKRDTTSEFTDMVDNWTTVIGDKYKWQEIGANIVEGIIKGLQDKAGDVDNTIEDIMSSGLETAQTTVDSHSPSRKYAEIGKYCMMGLANGIKNSAVLSYNSIKEVGTKTLSRMSTIMDNLSDMSIDGATFSPSIKPVIDLSKVQNGIQSLNGLFNIDRTLNLGLSLGKVGGEMTNTLKGLEDTTLSSNGKIVDAIGSLKGDIATLAEVMRNFKLYLDTGTLVGEISSDMDRSLGEIANLSKRGL